MGLAPTHISLRSYIFVDNSNTFIEGQRAAAIAEGSEVQGKLYRLDFGRLFDFYGGSTIIIDPYGKIRYVISKSLRHPARLESQLDFLSNSRSAGLWQERDGKLAPATNFFRLLDERS